MKFLILVKSSVQNLVLAAACTITGNTQKLMSVRPKMSKILVQLIKNGTQWCAIVHHHEPCDTAYIIQCFSSFQCYNNHKQLTYLLIKYESFLIQFNAFVCNIFKYYSCVPFVLKRINK